MNGSNQLNFEDDQRYCLDWYGHLLVDAEMGQPAVCRQAVLLAQAHVLRWSPGHGAPEVSRLRFGRGHDWIAPLEGVRAACRENRRPWVWA